MLKKIAKGLKSYLTDWKNLALHTIVGLLLVYVALFMPVEWYFRVPIFIMLVLSNLLRMHLEEEYKSNIKEDEK